MSKIVSKKTINVTRLENLRLLEFEYGTRAALAKALGTNEAGIERFFKKPKPTVMTVAFGRTVEKKLGKPKGWMDGKNCKLDLTSDERALLEDFREGFDWDRKIILTVAKMLREG